MLRILTVFVRPKTHACIRDTSSHQKQRALGKSACYSYVVLYRINSILRKTSELKEELRKYLEKVHTEFSSSK